MLLLDPKTQADSDYSNLTFAEQLIALKNLPSGLPPTHQPTANKEADFLYQFAENAHNLFSNDNNVNQASAKLAQKAYRRSAIAYKKAGNSLAETKALMNHALMVYYRGMPVYQKLYRNIIKKAFHDGHFECCKTINARLYTIYQQYEEHYPFFQLNPETIKLMRTLRRNARHIKYFSDHAPLIHNAYTVEQGEVGYSNQELMGTNYLHDCVALCIHDPQSKKTALMHIDNSTTIESIDRAFDRFPNKDTKENPFTIRLFGARHYERTTSPHYHDTSAYNLKKVIMVLHHRHTRVLSAQFGDKDQATNIIVNPQDFTLSHGASTYNRNTMAMHVFSTKQETRDIITAFDLTELKAYAPVLLLPQQRQAIHQRLAHKTDTQLFRALREKSQKNSATILAMVSDAVIVKHHIARSRSPLIKAIRQQIKSLKKRGCTVTDQIAGEVKRILDVIPYHVSDNAHQANRPLFDFIKNDLFLVDNNKNVTIDVAAALSFTFEGDGFHNLKKEAATRPITINKNIPDKITLTL